MPGISIQPSRPATREVSSAISREDGAVHLDSAALHDLVGPVNQMRSMVELLLHNHRGQLDDEAATLFEFIQAASDRMQNLMKGLRTHTRVLGMGQPARAFDANSLLAGVVGSLQQTIAQTDAVVTHDALPVAYGDPTQITFVFASLIENAIKFHGEQPPRVHVAGTPSGKGWMFSVRDNGIGIDPKYAEKIFAVFKRIHNDTYAGAGMGLTISRRIIERHGGRLTVESRLGQGATFFFTLPDCPD